MNKKPFESKHLFLTYPQCEGFTKLKVFQQLVDIVAETDRTILKYIVAEELHKDLGVHYHVYLELDAAIKSRNVRLFDLKLEQTIKHPNIQNCRKPLEVRRYCIKDGDYISNCSNEEFQEKQTSRDVQRLIGQRIIAGESLCTIILDYPEQIANYHRLVQSATLFRLHSLTPVQTYRTKGVWIWGKAGVGKSHFVREYCHERNLKLYIKSQEKWWDGYAGEPAILLDDFDTRKSDFGHVIKIWSDKYAVTAEIKCGTVPLMHVLFFVTSNYSIETNYEDVTKKDADGNVIQIITDRSELRSAVVRRFQVFNMLDREDKLDIVIPAIEPEKKPLVDAPVVQSRSDQEQEDGEEEEDEMDLD